MARYLFIILSFILIFCTPSANAEASFSFAESTVEETKQYVEALVASDKAPKDQASWISLSLELQKKYKSTPNWRLGQEARYAAVWSYHLASNDEEKAMALLVYGNTLDPEAAYESQEYLEVYRAANAFMNIVELRKKHPSVSELMFFRYIRTRINNQNAPPSACFLFSHPLVAEGVNYADYLNVVPKVDVSILAHDREICISPLQFGGTYDVTFKAGLGNELGEKIKEYQTISFKVRDQDTRLSFSNKAYVLVKDQSALIPLSGINVDAVSLKLLRINDRALNLIAGNVGRFQLQQPLWDYPVEEIANFQGELLWQGEMNLSGPRNQTVTKQFPFSEVVKAVQPGVYILQAEESGFAFGEKATATQWLIVSDIGLTVFSSAEEGILVSARSLKSAQPLVGVELALVSYNNTVLKKIKTSNDGIARFPSNLTRGKGGNRPALILAYGAQGDFSLLDLQQSSFDLSDRGVSGRKSPGPLDAYLYSEQGVYRPGDSIHLNALLRDDKGNAAPNLPLTFKLLRPDEVEVGQFTFKGTDLGFYEWVIPMSSSARIGQWTVLAFSDPKKEAIGKINFSVEDFVPSRVLVSLKTDQKQLGPKESIAISVEGRYLFGSNAAGMEGSASLLLRENSNPYPQYPGFRFGLVDEQWTSVRTPLLFEPLDQNGKETLTVALDKIPETTKPLEAVIKVTLTDRGGRPEIGTLKLPVSIFPYSIGIKSIFKEGVVPDSEQTADFEVITLDENGQLKAVSDLEYTLYSEEQRFVWFQSRSGSAWQYQTVTDDRFLMKGVLSTQAKAGSSLNVTLKDWGQYRLEVRDPNTKIASSIRFYKGWRTASGLSDSPDYLTIKADKESYAAGDNVSLQIEAPFEGQALLTIANQKVIQTKNITVSPKGSRVTLVVDNNWGLGAYCMVSAFRPLGNKSLEQKSYLPKRAVGVAWLGMDTTTKTFNISLNLPKEVRPRQTIEVPIQVDTKGKGTVSNAMLTLAAVDEGILKLTDFNTPNPQEYFYGKRQLGVEFRDLYGKIIQPLPGPIGQLRSGGDVSAISRNIQALSKRSFKVVSLYKGLIKLDNKGTAKVKLDLPDFNGSLRVMAVAFDDQRLGSGEANLLIRDPIILEGTLPRFLTPNDQSQLTLSLHNVAGQADQYTVQLESTTPIVLEKEKGFKTELEKGGVVHKVIPIKAVGLGEGKLIAHLKGSGVGVEHGFDIPVRSSVPYSSKTESQFLKEKESTKLKLPTLQDYLPGTERIQVSWSDRVPWDTEKYTRELLEYRYQCSEQTISKGIAALFSNKPQATNIVNQMLARLSEQQNGEGAFNLWFDTSKGDAWLTAYAVDFLQRASEKGYTAPKFTVERALKWLEKNLERSSKTELASLQSAAYTIYVLAKTSKVETGSLRYFQDVYYGELKDPLSRALVGAALVERGDLERANQAFSRVFEVGGQEARYRAPYGSSIRDRAGVLLLMEESILKAPSLKNLNPTIEGLKQNLAKDLSHKPRLSTNEQAWLILAAQVFNQIGSPIELSLNDKVYSSAHAPLIVDLSSEEFKKEITVQNRGKAPLWQHLEISGIPKETPKASTHGLSITRNYFTLEGQPLSLQNVSQGTQSVVVLEGKVLNEEQAHQLLIVDLLPAGFEIENAHLNQAQEVSSLPWLEGLSTALYTDARDDRFLGAVSLKEAERTFKMAYIVRAVTPGTYVHPALFVEDMYSPEYYARTEESSVQILPH